MTIKRDDHAREKGIALVYVGVFLVPLLACTGLAVDLGRGYLVRVALAKAVDAAALAAARNIGADSGQATSVANNIFNANFPPGFLGVTSVQNPPHIDTSIGSDGSYIITVSSTATLPTTFMRIAGRESLRVAAISTATRRLVDLSFAIDRSGSLSSVFDQVKAAAARFVGRFDTKSDRIALITFSSGTWVADKMGSARGFELGTITDHINSMSPGGGTATAEALYQAWDQLRAVPPGMQSGVRIVVLFTDGSPNSLPGWFRVMSPSATGCTSTLEPGVVAGTLSTSDYPFVNGTPAPTTDTPTDLGLFYTQGTSFIDSVPPTNWQTYLSPPSSTKWDINPCIPKLLSRSYHRFPLYDPALALHGQRVLIDQYPDGTYKNHVQNANNAARNLAEIIADRIRSDRSGHQIRIYTLGLGDLLKKPMGSKPETGESILRRIANDPDPLLSPDHNPDQLDGLFVFADKASDLDAAFEKVGDQVWRLTQ